MSNRKKKRRIIPFFYWGLSLAIGAFAILGINYFVNNTKTLVLASPQLTTEDTNKEQVINSIPSHSETKSSKHYNNIDDKIEEVSSQNKQKISSNTIEEKNQGISISKHSTATHQNIKVESTQNIGTFFQTKNYSNTSLDNLTKQEYSPLQKANTDIDNRQNNVALARNILAFNKIATPLNLRYNVPKIEFPFDYQIPVLNTSKSDKNFSYLKSISIYTQIGLGNKTIQGESDYARLRNESEELLEQLRIGIESDLISLLDFTLYGGIAYVSINDRVNLSKTYFEDQEIMFLKSIFVSQDGNEERIFDTKSLPHHILNKAVIHNSHRFISMPIGLKFGKNFSNLYFGLGFGLDLNYQLSDTHTIYGSRNEFIETPVGGKWINPSFHTSFIAEYPISENWIIHSKLMYRRISLEYNLKENYSLYGLDLGIKIRF